MKLLITGDTHNGVPGRLKDTIWSMSIIRQYAQKHGIEHVLVLGDLFHDRVNLNVEVLNAVYIELQQAKATGQQWLCFPGNHDMFLKNSWDITSLKPLEGVLQVYEQPCIITIADQRFHILPFVHYESEYMKQLEKLQKSYQKDDILLTHIGVHGAKLNECFLLKNWSIVDFDQSPYNIVYAGHFHCYQQVGKLWYPGNPIPFRFDEGLVDHGFVVYDTETRTHEFIMTFDVCGEFSEYKPPDYCTIMDTDVIECLHMVPGNNVKIVLNKPYTSNELKRIKTILNKKGARSISWMIYKRKIDEATDLNDDINQHLGSPEALFESWLEHDKPKLSLDLLRKIHGPIVQKAEERVVVEEE